MTTERDTYTDNRLTPPLTYDVLRSEVGLPPVYVVPSDNDRTRLCEVGSGEEFTRCTRAELREWAESILQVLGDAT